jgi:hypothetical protein
MSFRYCTIPDTSAPLVTWDTTSPWLTLHIQDNRPWDRGLRSVILLDGSNVGFSPLLSSVIPGQRLFEPRLTLQDSSLPSHCSIRVSDTAGNSANYSFSRQGVSGVSWEIQRNISVSLFPNPMNNITTIRLEGANSGEVAVMDVLGRLVDRFHIEGSYLWQPKQLQPGTYIVRALIGDLVVYKRIVRE